MFIARLLMSLSPHCWELCFMFLCYKIFEMVKVKSSTLLAELSFQHALCMSRLCGRHSHRLACLLGIFTFRCIACLLQL